MLAVASEYGKSPELAFRWGTAFMPRVVVDEPGVGGGVIDKLVELGVRPDAFNSGSRATNPDKYANRRAEAYWTLRKALEVGTLPLPRDEKLAQELCTMRWNLTPVGSKIIMEDKDKLKDRLNRSPDRADMLSMAVGFRRSYATVHPVLL